MVPKEELKRVAECLLKEEAEKATLNFPPPEGIILQWKGEHYFGSLQEIAPEFSREIVLLSKTSRPIGEELVNAVLDIQPGRPKVIADDKLNLEGRTHILRKIGSRLMECTSEQTEYILRNPPRVFEEGIELKLDLSEVKFKNL